MKFRNPEGALTSDEKAVVKALLAEGWRNQDIQALVNIGRDATINGARITEVKQDDKIQLASSDQVDFFKAKKQAYDTKTRLNIFDDERLIRAREAMILAVQVFNSPNLNFKTEVFAVLAYIAWTYLLHEHYDSKGIPVLDKDGHALLISQMIKREDWPLSKGIAKNLEDIKVIRDVVEHRVLGRSDQKWIGLFQACCLNFDKAICELFGEEVSLQKDLSIALQFSRLNINQAAILQKYDVPEHIEALDARLLKNRTEDELADLDYRFRIVFTMDAASKSKSNIQFIEPGSEEGKQIHNVLLKYKTSDELYPYKPSKVVSLVAENSRKSFSAHNHTQAWKKYKARPSNGAAQPANTNTTYCIYHRSHGDYTYSDGWVSFLSEIASDDKRYAELKAFEIN